MIFDCKRVSFILALAFLLRCCYSDKTRSPRRIFFEHNVSNCLTQLGEACETVTSCAAYVAMRPASDLVGCTLRDGSGGICCPAIQLSEVKPVLDYEEQKVMSLPEVDELPDVDIEVEEEIASGKDLQGAAIEPGSTSDLHSRVFLSSKESDRVAREALRVIESLQKRAESLTETLFFSSAGYNPASVQGACLVNPTERCRLSKYRTVDGSCNNLQHPRWGMSMTALQRVRQADYFDGLYVPRKAAQGLPLPSSRVVSSFLISRADIMNRDVTLLLPMFGQFIDHDLSLTPNFKAESGPGIECCTSDRQVLPEGVRDSHCFPIDIPPSDPLYGKEGIRCMNFVRSLTAPRTDCTFGHAEQLNDLTHWLDGSQIYGSDFETSAKLRVFAGGLLLTSVSQGITGELLPIILDDDVCAAQSNSTDPCFRAGDVRAKENPILAVMHTVWLREHNRVAHQLALLNPLWTDEVLFQEARRIVTAEYQHITLNEFLPPLLGYDYMTSHGMLIKQSFHERYDEFENVDPSITNEFSTAAFRMGHSLLSSIIPLISKTLESSSIPLSTQFFAGRLLQVQGFIDDLLRGLLQVPTLNFDNAVTMEVAGKLFRQGGRVGLDLPALNIQRGRDHGLPGYTTYRSICALPPANTFEELSPYIRPELIARLRTVYRSVEDIDLFMGGISERSVEGSLLGPTFACIIGDQFNRLRHADRFFYDVGGQPHSFKRAQLREIRKSTLARILCDNSDGPLDRIQPLALLAATSRNTPVTCDSPSIPRVDLKRWMNERI